MVAPPAPPPPPPSPAPLPPWTGIAVANVWRLPNNSAVLGAVMLADAAVTDKVTVQFGVLPAGVSTAGTVWVLHPNATRGGSGDGGWVSLGRTKVGPSNVTVPVTVPLHRGCAFVKLTSE